MTTTTPIRVTPNADQIARTKAAIDHYITSIDQNPDRRDGAYPYYLFHEPSQPIFGTVMLFHGFSARPHQMWRLADYLFRSGFNVYQASLAGHSFLPADRYWPQIDLKPEYAEPLKRKVKQDPVLMGMLTQMMGGDPTQIKHPNPLQQAALAARLLRIEPELFQIKKALEDYDNPNFDRYFTSSHENYLTEARSRLTELDAMPGAIYTIGLSVGGAVALALAADQPDRIQRVVAYAPLLEIHGKDNELYVNIAGPLDLQEAGWDPSLRFPVGCFTANNRFGDFVLRPESMRTLRRIPTCLILTENEDAADLSTNEKFTQKLGGEAQGHYSYLYSAGDLVPHPMVDPTEVSQSMSNRYWQTMYQETYRFLVQGRIDPDNLARLHQDGQLPLVPDLT
ncbi:MAG: alpha/beta hydrolase [Synechococcales cyanobacterium K44_A2020_017]|nr:alpha/beta hydrolase [Synechococcales cyanobacterium K32_A2020_035]MBF2095810.1 alpha/beta hydrolase [Synechococcales cyanobacterium K44_A2020_017]